MTDPASIYRCPVCGNPLVKNTGRYACVNRHSFDIAKEGYVNLAWPSNRPAGESGDNREMVAGRRDFLAGGYYDPLADALVALTRDLPGGSAGTLVDSGCGEGFYLRALERRLSMSCYGFDLSRWAIKSAARASATIDYAVANVFRLPVFDGCADIALSVFAPFNEDEIFRVLKSNGFWIVVSPGRHHLFELKQNLYATVALNESGPSFKRFEIVAKSVVDYEVDIQDNVAVRNLLKMTPYYWKTGKEAIERAENLAGLKTRVEFDIVVARRGDL
jgi:23S rRNA (guanine745-N1)-methyltransferase